MQTYRGSRVKNAHGAGGNVKIEVEVIWSFKGLLHQLAVGSPVQNQLSNTLPILSFSDQVDIRFAGYKAQRVHNNIVPVRASDTTLLKTKRELISSITLSGTIIPECDAELPLKIRSCPLF
ncbi:hypothetical protein ACP86_19200 [Marinobacter sp. CP1]|nr:hypothetical protein ACP86_19200 [Marinobacter sp. CP1]